MRPIKLLIYSMSESFLKVLLLIVTSAVTLIYSLYAVSLLSEYYEVIYNAVKANLTNKVIVYTDLQDEYQNEGNYKEILEQINGLSDRKEIKSVVVFEDSWWSLLVDNYPGIIPLMDFSYIVVRTFRVISAKIGDIKAFFSCRFIKFRIAAVFQNHNRKINFGVIFKGSK